MVSIAHFVLIIMCMDRNMTLPVFKRNHNILKISSLSPEDDLKYSEILV